MNFTQMSTDPSKYVVIDVETNGLSSKEHDLLSIALYRPDNGDLFEKFLPLELNSEVFTTEINGITEDTLLDALHLTQADVDDLFKRFDLGSRTILHFGSIDPKFLNVYFYRHHLIGFEEMSFFNFKKLICATKFSDGSITKDNLCKAFKIEGITDVHAASNDCILEWKLFEAMGGRPILVNQKGEMNNVWVLDPDYLIPASYVQTYPNLAELCSTPSIGYEEKFICRLEIPGERLRKFKGNITGLAIEHLIKSMLHAETEDNFDFLANNKMKNHFVGSFPSRTRDVPLNFLPDGSVSAVRDRDKDLASEINEVQMALKRMIVPLVDFIKKEVFHNKKIYSQSLSVDEKHGVIALSDFATNEAVIELKTSFVHPKLVAEQLYYEAQGRDSFWLSAIWNYLDDGSLSGICFYLARLKTFPVDEPKKKRADGREVCKTLLNEKQIAVTNYLNTQSKVGLRCEKCGHLWEATYQKIKGGNVVCQMCKTKH